MKLFVPLTDAFLVPAQAIILQILFSKTIEDFCTEESHAKSKIHAKRDAHQRVRVSLASVYIYIYIHTYTHIYIYIS